MFSKETEVAGLIVQQLSKLDDVCVFLHVPIGQ